jgi:hypothetical protein
LVEVVLRDPKPDQQATLTEEKSTEDPNPAQVPTLIVEQTVVVNKTGQVADTKQTQDTTSIKEVVDDTPNQTRSSLKLSL